MRPATVEEEAKVKKGDYVDASEEEQVSWMRRLGRKAWKLAQKHKWRIVFVGAVAVIIAASVFIPPVGAAVRTNNFLCRASQSLRTPLEGQFLERKLRSLNFRCVLALV
jgi:HJR/Mrr/RecB family endonuclease